MMKLIKWNCLKQWKAIDHIRYDFLSREIYMHNFCWSESKDNVIIIYLVNRDQFQQNYESENGRFHWWNRRVHISEKCSKVSITGGKDNWKTKIQMFSYNWKSVWLSMIGVIADNIRDKFDESDAGVCCDERETKSRWTGDCEETAQLESTDAVRQSTDALRPRWGCGHCCCCNWCWCTGNICRYYLPMLCINEVIATSDFSL